MATLRNKRKLAAVSRDRQKSARNGQSQNTFVPGMTEEYITQVSEEIERRVTEKMSLDFSRTESRILGALSKLDEFLLNPQVRTCSGTVPGTSRNNDSENREPTGDRSLNDSYPEVEFCVRQASTSGESDREEISHNFHSATALISGISTLLKETGTGMIQKDIAVVRQHDIWRHKNVSTCIT